MTTIHRPQDENEAAGIIRAARFYGDFFTRRDPADVETALVGAPHRQDELRARLAVAPVAETFVNVNAEELLSVLH